nr:putative retrotransposon protein [Tanacetum cinerariifolium]
MYGGKPDTELDVTGFCDASWQCDKDDTKSQTGYVFVVNGGAVDWKSKKQTTIAMYSAQAEYVAASEAAIEAVWIRKFVGDLGVMPSINKPINMYCDNSAAIIFANEPAMMKGARHFLRRHHYVREQVETGEIKLIKVHTDDNLADHFTKALPRGMFIDHAKGIGLQLASSFMHICDYWAPRGIGKVYVRPHPIFSGIRSENLVSGRKNIKQLTIKKDNPTTTKSTMVSFKPDSGCLEDDTLALMKRRVVDLAGCCSSVKVELNGTCDLPRTFQDYAKLYLQTFTHSTRMVYQKVNDRWEICVAIEEHFILL